MLQDRSDDERSSFADLNTLRGSSPRNASVGARGTFHGLLPLHVRSERSPLHDVRQHAHANDAWTRRIACANLFHGRAAGESELIDRWWSQTESNRRPPACKAGALPTELWPRIAAPAKREMVGLGRFELPTSRLSSARSNQLSYRPNSIQNAQRFDPRPKTRCGQKDAPTTHGMRGLVREERETKTAKSR